MFVKKVGIDLGTANTLVYVPNKGIVIDEPSVVAVSMDDNSILAVGNEAKKMLGRTPDTIVASRPLKDGVIADYRVTEAMLKYFITKAIGNVRLFRPEVMVSIPAGITSTERRAVIDASTIACRNHLISAPVSSLGTAAALKRSTSSRVRCSRDRLGLLGWSRGGGDSPIFSGCSPVLASSQVNNLG